MSLSVPSLPALVLQCFTSSKLVLFQTRLQAGASTEVPHRLQARLPDWAEVCDQLRRREEVLHGEEAGGDQGGAGEVRLCAPQGMQAGSISSSLLSYMVSQKKKDVCFRKIISSWKNLLSILLHIYPAEEKLFFSLALYLIYVILPCTTQWST